MRYFINKRKVSKTEAREALEKYDKVLLERNGNTLILNIREIRDEELRVEREMGQYV